MKTKEKIKEAVLRLDKFRDEIKSEIISTFKEYKKGIKGLENSIENGYKITNKGLKNHTFLYRKEDKIKEWTFRLLYIFRSDRYSNKKNTLKCKEILKELFKEDKEILRILNYSWKMLEEQGVFRE